MPVVKIGPYQSYEVIVDECDLHLLDKYNYYHERGYAKRRLYIPAQNGNPSSGASFYLHRDIMQPEEGYVVDHIDGNRLNNSRSNLRVCSPEDNRSNIPGTGAFWVEKLQKYQAKITHKGTTYKLGYFENFDDAVAAYKQKSKELRGDFHRND